MYRVSSLVVIVLCAALTGSAQTSSLRATLDSIAGGIHAKVGVAVYGIESPDTLTVGGGGRYPMQSVFKFPLAVAVLHAVDQGKLSLGQKVHIRKKDLLPNTWSPLRQKYPGGNVDVTLDEIIRSTVAQSDNNGCDLLFRMMGGPAAVNRYIHSLGVTDIAIVNTEAEMHRDDRAQYRNWCAPGAMALLLKKFYRGEVLAHATTAYLREVMEGTTTGPRRIKGLLPEGTVVAHKTGSSGVYGDIVPATNDVGVITLPDGRHLALVVFVTDAHEPEVTCEDAIGRVARAVWDAHVRP